ncbi:hypothetical protein A2982_02985 [candidate division WWE3 bacterium RIFCSPLOWO2_01_FULL_39_13]|uniref:Nucleotidyl transferase AbiEii/AbiGii toxin family protein n=1 Tax=candidate division WWE3 bacterium RIFCSPLOWO2_01_FULL_39_13 TaxID=1802624 RepID=A0A1F4V1R8_UNCKA|nr:MAG: hypothetical protein A2982_02985 [candidate division WWE3 bacterium RIFCSPLOWO2_01_FULL_39_13]
MILPKAEDARHKVQMYRLLRAILEDSFLSSRLMFKGGTYAALRGVLDRFSIDLDFDLPDKSVKQESRTKLHSMFKQLRLGIKDESKEYLQFFLKYDAPEKVRNTLKLEINDKVTKFDRYEKVYLPEISMYCNGHTLDTMFAYKLIAAKARYDKTGNIAGRDFYDIHKFFVDGLPINTKTIQAATGKKYEVYLGELSDFIDEKLADKLLMEDLNLLLPKQKMDDFIKAAKPELKMFLSKY